MPYGLKDIELAKLNEVFAANERIERVILYGSRAKGNYKPFSDVDITLEGAELTHNDLSRLSLAIDDLLLPYQFDISIFHALKNEALIDHIRRMGITIYERESDWKEYKLGEIASFVTEKVSVQDVKLEDYISTENMLPDKGGITIASNKPQEGSATKYFNDTILISNIRPYFKKIWYADKVGGCSNDVLCFKAKDELVFSKYLYFLLSQDTFFDYVMLGSKGCKMPRGDKSHIMNWEISIPPLPTQRRIATILSSLDDKIDLLHRENATLEQMAETLFRQWFVVEAKEEWEEGKLGDVLTVKGGTTPSTKEPSFWNGEIAWTSPRDVTTLKGLFLFETEKTITQKGLEQISSGLLPAGTLLMSSRAPVGVLAFAVIPLAINQGYIAILDDKGYPKEFIYLWLKANMDLVHSYSNGSTFMEISKSAFKSLDIVIPTKAEVVDFVLSVKPFFEKIKMNEKQIKLITRQRDSLLLKMMSNEIKLL